MPREPGMDTSLWAASAEAAPETVPLDGDRKTDVAIVGAGYTGCSAALHLAEGGVDVVVLEAKEIGWGGSGRNSGFVNAGLWLDPNEVERRIGPEYGPRLVAALDKTPDLVESVIDRHGIRCDFSRKGMLRGAHSAGAMRGLEETARQWQTRGANIEVLDRARAAEMIGSERYVGATLDHRAGIIQPLSYARGLGRAAVGAGAAFHTGTAVTAMTRDSGTWRLETPKGAVTADAVILATNAYSDDLWPGLRETVIPIGTIAYASEPLGENVRNTILPGGQGFWDTQPAIIYVHIDRDRRMIMGTLGWLPFAAGTARHSAWPNRVRRRLFPQLGDVPWTFDWAGTIGFTTDHIPRLHEPASNVYVAIGYNGRGIGPGTFWGKMLAQRIMGMPAEELPLPVTPVRPATARGLRSLLFDTAFRAYRWKSFLG